MDRSLGTENLSLNTTFICKGHPLACKNERRANMIKTHLILFKIKSIIKGQNLSPVKMVSLIQISE